MSFDFTEHSHKRFNPLNNSWVLCSPHRAKRPWLGQTEKLPVEESPVYDPKCFLCPGNKRVGGDVNPKYSGTFIFPNDFPAVTVTQPPYDQDRALNLDKASSDSKEKMKRLFNAQGVRGCARVICFSPNHNLTMAEMGEKDILEIINQWILQMNDLLSLDYVNYVQLFGKATSDLL